MIRWRMFERGKRKNPGARAARKTSSLTARIIRGWRPWHTIAVLVILFLGSTGFGAVWGAWERICLDDRCPSIAQITVWEPEESSKLYASDGSLVREFFKERRTAIDLVDLPPYVAHAFVAIEDKRFYRHRGLDHLRLARATFDYALHGAGRPGGSTITQQLARNQFPDRVGFDISPVRKVREAKVARDIERIYSKSEILEAYLNQINFGHGWYGIETASQNYFGKPASEINLPETALLAALPKAPSRYSPYLRPEAALGRRNLVLSVMARQGYITEAEAEAAKAYPLPRRRNRSQENYVAPHFVEWVRRMLDERFGEDLYRAGFRIYTTLDLEMQAIADSALKAQLTLLESVDGYEHMTYEEALELPPDSVDWRQTPYLQGMFVALDPKTGYVRAMIGGRDWNHSQFNRATQAFRQTGSVFKPFVYTAAIASGFPASHVIYDAPLELDQYDPEGDSTWIWSPKNYTNTFRGPTTLRDALRRSVNVVTVKLAQEVGVETVAQFARRMGIRTRIPRVAAASIGAASVTPIEVVEAFTSFANLGVHVTPQPILRIEDNTGRTLWEPEPRRERILDQQTAWIMLTILRDVVNPGGTAGRVRREWLGPEIPAAGKTGTTNDASDVWFVGFTPDLLAGVWIGLDEPKQIFPRAVGGGHAAPVWGAFMQRVYQTRAIPEPWERPGGLVYRAVNRVSGKLQTEYCPLDEVYTEVYLPGTEPEEECDLHQPTPWGLPALPPNRPNDQGGQP